MKEWMTLHIKRNNCTIRKNEVIVLMLSMSSFCYVRLYVCTILIMRVLHIEQLSPMMPK